PPCSSRPQGPWGLVRVSQVSARPPGGPCARTRSGTTPLDGRAPSPPSSSAPVEATVANSPESRAELTAPATRPLERATILVVDDDPVTRTVVSTVLKLEEDYHVLEAEDGRKALELAREARPGLVILDLTMPELDGFSVCRALRADHELAMVRVLILSGHGDEDDK